MARLALALTLGGVLVAIPSTAAADWKISAFLGKTWTPNTTLELEQPARGTDVRFEDVPFSTESFRPPVYYSFRLTMLPTESTSWGVEVEFTHTKVIADPDAVVTTTGSFEGIDVSGPQRLGDYVEHFSISHGFNHLLGNVVWRTPLAPRATLTLRAGAGITIPHGESTIRGRSVGRYEGGGLALLAGAGVELAIAGPLHLVIEYKLTRAAVRVAVDQGTADASFTNHHLLTGIAVTF